MRTSVSGRGWFLIFFSRFFSRCSNLEARGKIVIKRGGGGGEGAEASQRLSVTVQEIVFQLILFSRQIFVLFNHFPDLLLCDFFFFFGWDSLRVIFNSSIKLTIIVYTSVSLFFFFQLLTFWNIRINL